MRHISKGGRDIMAVVFERILESFTIIEDDQEEIFDEEAMVNNLEQQIAELLIKQELGVLI